MKLQTLIIYGLAVSLVGVSTILIRSKVMEPKLLSLEDESSINTEYQLDPNSMNDNDKAIDQLKSTITELASIESAALNDSILLNISQTERDKIYEFEQLVRQAFDPKNYPCELPNAVRRKLERTGGFFPKQVARFMNDRKWPEKVSVLHGKTLEVLMHLVEVKNNQGGTIFKQRPLGGPTFKDFAFRNYLLRGDYLLFSLDCQGYFNASVGAALNPGLGINLKAEADANADKDGSMFLGYGTIISPLTLAFYKSYQDMTMNDKLRYEVLSEINSIPGLNPTDEIIPHALVEVLFISTEGSQSFNGSGNINSTVLTLKGSAGGSLSRQTEFAKFDIYYSKDNVLDDGYTSFKVKSLRDSITAIKKRLKI